MTSREIIYLALYFFNLENILNRQMPPNQSEMK